MEPKLNVSNRPIYGEEPDRPKKLGPPYTRVEPSGLEEYRRHHELRAPSCLCAFADNVEYTESRIGIVQGGKQGGVYVAECERSRCGYRGERLNLQTNNPNTYSC